MRNISLIIVLLFVVGCAGFNPNPGERITDMAWTCGKFDHAYETAKSQAEAGMPWAQFRMGIFYSNGWGVEKNYKKSYEWYVKAVAQKADDNWANGLLIGVTGKPGYFNQNSDALIAEYNLANLYYRGDGIEKDFVKSYVHVSKVINESKGNTIFFCCEFAGGRSFTQSQLTELKEKITSVMTSEQLAEASAILAK